MTDDFSSKDLLEGDKKQDVLGKNRLKGSKSTCYLEAVAAVSLPCTSLRC